jgi:hypothetical protein
MFEKFLSANAQDFRTRYQGTYGFYRTPAKNMLCKLTFVEGNVTFVDKKQMEYTLYPDSQSDIGFEFIPPRSSYYNTPKGAFYVERVASRQFQRGVSEKNTRIYSVGLKGFASEGVNFDTLGALYENDVSLKEALESFFAERTPSVAISKTFAISKKYLWVLSTLHGEVLECTPKKIVLRLKDADLFRTEITDALRGVIDVEFAK